MIVIIKDYGELCENINYLANNSESYKNMKKKVNIIKDNLCMTWFVSPDL